MAALRNSLIVDPWEFKEHLDAILMGKNACLVNLWDDNPGSTKEWEKDGGVYHQIAKALGLQYWADYWHLDAVLFKDSDKLLSYRPYSNYATFLSVAMEHENDFTTSREEMNKLSIFNASLKVLVTYPYSRADGRKLLDDYAKQVKSADVFGDFEDKRRQMVIFGRKKNDTIRWEYYLFKGEQFVSM